MHQQMQCPPKAMGIQAKHIRDLLGVDAAGVKLQKLHEILILDSRIPTSLSAFRHLNRQAHTLTMQRASTVSSLLPSACEGMSQSPSPTRSRTRCPTFFNLGASCLH